MLSRNPSSIRYAYVFVCLTVLFGVLVLSPAPLRVGAQLSKASLRLDASQPLAPDAASVCLGSQDLNQLGSGTYNRPSTTFTQSTVCDNVPGGLAGFGAGDRYNAYGYNVSGCTGTIAVTASTCTGNGCGTNTSSTDTTVYVYQKIGGAVGTPGSKVFDPASPLTNLRAGNGSACSPQASVTVNVCPGVFIVVVADNLASTTTGIYNLNVSATGTGTCTVTRVSEPSAADGSISGRISDGNGTGVAGAVVNLSGAQNRKTITDANGNYQFSDVETIGFYTVTPSRANYSFSPAERSFSQLGNNTEATFAATPAGGFTNPLDMPEYFVRQHYLDFLGREPDEAGFNFWSNQMLACGSDEGCRERRRINVSAAYFLSTEFQRTGGLVDALYRASYGASPQFAEFVPDTATLARGVVVGRIGWQQLLAANKEAFMNAWVERPAFRAAYDLLTNDSYVDSLIAHTGVTFTPSERDALVSGLALGTLSRAGVLQGIAEDERFVAAKRNEAFVMMEYFGYLQRDPDAGGFAFWLDKLNHFGGNFEQADMVKAFIDSGEYRDRFSR